MNNQHGYPHQQPPPGQPYGHPPQPGQPYPGQAPYGQPPPGAYGHPPPGAYGQPMTDPRIKELNDQSPTWLLISIIGFWLGVGFISGPLAWIKGSRLRANYRSMGMAPAGNATGAWIIGMVSTALYAITVLAVVGMLTLFAGAIAASGV